MACKTRSSAVTLEKTGVVERPAMLAQRYPAALMLRTSRCMSLGDGINAAAN
jgi:hypothetical protein